MFVDFLLLILKVALCHVCFMETFLNVLFFFLNIYFCMIIYFLLDFKT